MIWSVPFTDIHHDPEGNEPEVIGPLQIFPDDTERSKVFLGPLPMLADSFLVYSAQERRKIYRSSSISISDMHSFDSQNISIFGITDCMIGAPSFSPSLIAQLSKRSASKRVSYLLPSFYFAIHAVSKN